MLPTTESLLDSACDAVRPWYLAYTKPQQETLAHQQLNSQGFETYLPLYRVHKKPRGARVDTPAVLHHEPMFPRYIFVRPSRATQSIASARFTRGVNNLVSFGQVLAIVGETVVAALRELEAERNQAPADSLSPYQPGNRVRLLSSGLQELQGLVVSQAGTRVRILLEILGGQRMVSVATEHITPT